MQPMSDDEFKAMCAELNAAAFAAEQAKGGPKVSSERTYDDDGNEQFIVYGNDASFDMLTITKFEGQYYGLLDFGSCDVEGEPAATPLQAYFNVRKRSKESEEWAEKMLADMAVGMVEFDHEPAQVREDDIIEMKGSWKIKPVN